MCFQCDDKDDATDNIVAQRSMAIGTKTLTPMILIVICYSWVEIFMALNLIYQWSFWIAHSLHLTPYFSTHLSSQSASTFWTPFLPWSMRDHCSFAHSKWLVLPLIFCSNMQSGTRVTRIPIDRCLPRSKLASTDWSETHGEHSSLDWGGWVTWPIAPNHVSFLHSGANLQKQPKVSLLSDSGGWSIKLGLGGEVPRTEMNLRRGFTEISGLSALSMSVSFCKAWDHQHGDT